MGKLYSNALRESSESLLPNRMTVGVLYYVSYHLADDSLNRKIIVATTRPETIAHDVALIVHASSPYAQV
jgi:valyl-tRNA synthetase